MVLRFPDLPDALQHYFVEQLCNKTTAGRLAQASQACKLLLLERLEALKEKRRLLAEQRAQARRDQKRELILSCFEPLEEGAIVYRCIIHRAAMGATPCRCTLRIQPALRNKLAVMCNHLKHAHPAQYGIMAVMFD